MIFVELESETFFHLWLIASLVEHDFKVFGIFRVQRASGPNTRTKTFQRVLGFSVPTQFFTECIRCFSVAVIKYEQKQLMEKIFLGWQFWKDRRPSWQGGKAARADIATGSWEITASVLNNEAE